MAIRKVVSRSIGTDVIAAEDLAANSVTVAELSDDAVTSAKIDSTSTGMALADLTVNTNTLVVDGTNGKVGMGVTNPNDYYSGSNQLVVSGGLSIKDSGGVSRLEFVDGTSGSDAYVGNIVYVHSGDYMRFNAGVSQRLRIDADGLKFGSDSAAANALDDYEEGTWTPNIGGRSFGQQFGIYRKIGNVVFISFACNNMSGGSVSNGSITGLPFAATNSANIDYGGWITIQEPYNFTLSSGYTYVYARASKNSTDAVILQGNGAGHNSGVVINNGANFRGNGFYLTD